MCNWDWNPVVFLNRFVSLSRNVFQAWLTIKNYKNAFCGQTTLCTVCSGFLCITVSQMELKTLWSQIIFSFDHMILTTKMRFAVKQRFVVVFYALLLYNWVKVSNGITIFLILWFYKILTTKSWKKNPQKFLIIPQIHFFSLLPWLPKQKNSCSKMWPIDQLYIELRNCPSFL